MNSLLGQPLALASRSTNMFRNLGDGFRHKQESFHPLELVGWFLLIVALFVGLGLLSRMLARRDKRQLYNSPRALFNALCRVHDLDARSRRLLKRLAADRGLECPAQLFLSPDCFDSASWGPSLVPQATALSVIEKKLFGPGRLSRASSFEARQAQQIALESSHN